MGGQNHRSGTARKGSDCGASLMIHPVRAAETGLNTRHEETPMPLRSILCVLMLLLTSAFVNDARAKDNEPIKVFLLLGQSNMQGKGSANHLKELVQAEPEKYGHLMKDGQWIKRQDVWASFHDGAATPLTVGTTTRPGGRVGPEIGFGKVVGDAIDGPMLLKIAWGGQSLAVDFNPPSQGKWGDRAFKYKGGESWKPGSIGWAYQMTFNEMHASIENTRQANPALRDRKFEICGIVWFQGWNDLINGQYRAEYQENLVAYIKSMREHLNKPNLPFVIGVVGHGGDNPNGKNKELREAQMAPAKMKEFRGNVAAVPTAPFWDPENRGDGGYHYNGSASFFYDAGVAFGEAMLELLETYEGKKAEEQEAEKKPAEPINHQPRTWTGTNGKTITGTFVRASGGKVVLLLENGRKREYASRNFTEEDRAYIRKYAD